ncbi:beta-N-acetylhexosaminidase [Natronospira proteinivora]|uniref:Beta-hexosaminidase n=1 Tax=Natronospira proteinivora TaxID=1807133 RepID=A0ABT1G5W0_9GAMM|nr:beta-N-acetylhexosaminidase [Natronospira proteinivora]MCP1726689.1 beta-N-acetylhexosaminidase [Natronospira proteinivora]
MVAGPVMMDLEGTSLSREESELLAHPAVGGVILFSRNYDSPGQLSRLTSAIRASRETPLLIAVDQEGGRVQRFHQGFTRLPPMARLGEAFDADPSQGLQLAELCGWVMASELRAHDLDLSFAPVVDLDFGASAVIGDRAFHDDPETVFRLARALVTGMRAGGMSATAKHFPGHGGVVLDSHVDCPEESRSLDDLREWDMQPFARLIRMDLPSVMMAHVVYSAVDSRPASFSRPWIQDILRTQLGFAGAVVADDLCMAAAIVLGTPAERARMALEAGCDLIPVCNDRAAAVEVIQAVGGDTPPATRHRLARLRSKARQTATPNIAIDWEAARRKVAQLSKGEA